MADPTRRITVEDGGRPLGGADLRLDPESGAVLAALHVESGHLPPGTRTRLVDAVLDQPEHVPGTRIQAAVPVGDGEILSRLRERCTGVEMRAAGASCLIDGTVPER